MTARRVHPKNGRKAFKGMAPKGFAIRMMEPGEVPALLRIQKAAASRAPHGPAGADDRSADITAFTRYLLGHEVFVAISKKTEEPIGFATAAAESDLYWISRLLVHPDDEADDLDSALLKAVAERAHWFFYRAIGVSVAGASSPSAAFFEKHGFIRVPNSDLPAWLDEKRRDAAGHGDANEQIVMIRWL